MYILFFLCFDEILNELDFDGIEASQNHKEYNLIANKKHSTNSNLILKFYEQRSSIQRLPLSKEYNFYITAQDKFLDLRINIDFSYLLDGSHENGVSIIIDGTSKEFEFQSLDALPNTIRNVQKYLKEKMYQLKKEEILRRVERGRRFIRKNSQETPNTPSNSSTDSTK